MWARSFDKIFKSKKGIIITYVLVFGAIFLMMISGILGFILLQLKQSAQKLSWNQALDIAEAGIDRYRWCLNNGIEASCTGEMDFYDSQGHLAGKFSIDVSTNVACGQTTQRRITSTGWTIDHPSVKRSIRVVYGRESVAKYSYVLNSHVWIGGDQAIHGPYHSNGGVRMDGTNYSLVTSATVIGTAGEWVCTSSFGCSPCPVANGCRIFGLQCICPGVFTTTSNPETSLFQYPEPNFDFNAITVDLAQIKDRAQNGGGIYLPKSTTINANGDGYHFKFQSDGTVQVWLVTGASNIYGYSIEEGYHWERFIIPSGGESLYSTYTIPADCSVIYAEDNLWVEGTVKGKVVVASANLIDATDTSIVVSGDIAYSTNDGSDGLGMIAEKNVLIGPVVPNDMVIHAIIVAQKGRFGRNHYEDNGNSIRYRNSLKIYGSVISSGRVGTQWVSGGSYVGGFAHRESYYDPDQVFNPPPFVAHMGSDFKIVSWREID